MYREIYFQACSIPSPPYAQLLGLRGGGDGPPSPTGLRGIGGGTDSSHVTGVMILNISRHYLVFTFSCQKMVIQLFKVSENNLCTKKFSFFLIWVYLDRKNRSIS